MLVSYYPGRGLCYIDSVNNAKQKLRNADIFRRTNCKPCTVVTCFNSSTLIGGTPSSSSSYFMDGGTPLSNSTCYTDGGYLKSSCFNNPTLIGGFPLSKSKYSMNGGNPISNPKCYIDGSNP
jgi:hypothetical protein